jgi:curli biogenesis system outer membrane secretion channel CsgG
MVHVVDQLRARSSREMSMMIQQSNCFIVVERGTGMQNVMQERQLSKVLLEKR